MSHKNYEYLRFYSTHKRTSYNPRKEQEASLPIARSTYYGINFVNFRVSLLRLAFPSILKKENQ